MSINIKAYSWRLCCERNHHIYPMESTAEFSAYNHIYSVFGFSNDMYTAYIMNCESENLLNMFSINSLLISIDIISDSFVHWFHAEPAVYAFFLMHLRAITLSRYQLI